MCRKVIKLSENDLEQIREKVRLRRASEKAAKRTKALGYYTKVSCSNSGIRDVGSTGKGICSICGMIFNPNIKSDAQEHNYYHSRIKHMHQEYGIECTIREAKALKTRALQEFKNSEASENCKMQACKDLVISAYSMHSICCLQCNTGIYPKDEYCKEWVACNIEQFPVALRDWISDFYGVDKNTWILDNVSDSEVDTAEETDNSNDCLDNLLKTFEAMA